MSEIAAKLGLAGGLTAVGLAVACILYFVLRGRLQAWRRGRRIAAEATEIEEFRKTVGELLVELDQSAARVAAQIQEHFERLDALQRDVDDKLRRYSLASAAPTAVIAERSTRSEPATKANAAIPVAGTRASRKHTAQEQWHSASSKGPDESAGASASAPVTANRDPRVDRVFELSDAGEKPIRIAEFMGMLLGEVELLLALRKYR